MFIAALLTIAKLWNHPSCPTADEWIKNCGTYAQHRIINKNEIISFSGMDGSCCQDKAKLKMTNIACLHSYA
jgi:hypothetical protein